MKNARIKTRDKRKSMKSGQRKKHSIIFKVAKKAMTADLSSEMIGIR